MSDWHSASRSLFWLRKELIRNKVEINTVNSNLSDEKWTANFCDDKFFSTVKEPPDVAYIKLQEFNVYSNEMQFEWGRKIGHALYACAKEFTWRAGVELDIGFVNNFYQEFKTLLIQEYKDIDVVLLELEKQQPKRLQFSKLQVSYSLFNAMLEWAKGKEGIIYKMLESEIKEVIKHD